MSSVLQRDQRERMTDRSHKSRGTGKCRIVNDRGKQVEMRYDHCPWKHTVGNPALTLRPFPAPSPQAPGPCPIATDGVMATLSGTQGPPPLLQDEHFCGTWNGPTQVKHRKREWKACPHSDPSHNIPHSKSKTTSKEGLAEPAVCTNKDHTGG